MVRLTLGEKGERLKWNLYFFTIVLLIGLGACLVCSRIDWSALQRSEFEKFLLEREMKILMMSLPREVKARKLLGECHKALNSRWLTGYFYDRNTGLARFIGRTAPRDFRKAVAEQKEAIDSGKPFDEKRIPKLRMVVDFERLNCRLLVAEYEMPR